VDKQWLFLRRQRSACVHDLHPSPPPQSLRACFDPNSSRLGQSAPESDQAAAVAFGLGGEIALG
jgi:hypothetical protein